MKKEALLAYFPKITTARYNKLKKYFTNIDDAWQASFKDLKLAGWKEDTIHEWQIWKNEIDEAKQEKILDQEQITCVTIEDIDFPPLLKEINDPPFCLFVRGKLNPKDFSLAIVGTRKNSPYGKQVTEKIVTELSQNGITIISGLALGIDGIAHTASIQSNGITIAVLGSGINRQHIYPAKHKQLSEKIISSGGAIISEYPPGTLPNKFTFPKRNRIVAGMSLGTLVIEAPQKSGALITADCALQYNREVFAIPQNITSPTSIGTNNLIKEGAHPITSAKDILDILNLQNIKKFETNKEIIPDSPIEAIIIRYLSQEPTHIDQLIKQSLLPSNTIMSNLTLMEMKGKIKNLGNMMYILSR